MKSVPHAANAKFHAGIVREKSITRQLIEAGNQILNDGYSNNFSADQLLEAGERKVFEIAEDRISGETVDLRDVLMKAMERISRFAADRGASLRFRPPPGKSHSFGP